MPALHCACIRFAVSVLNAILFKKHLEEDETLMRVVHKHWLLGIRILFWPTLFGVGMVWLLTLVQTRGMYIVVAILSVVICVWWLRNFFDYYLDAWLVTNHGIIDIAWFGWFHRQSTRVLYSDLQGISYEINGVFGTILRFGTVSIEKISTGTAVSLEFVGSPMKVESVVLKNMEAYLHKKNMKDAKHVQELLATIVANQIHLKEMKGDVTEDEVE
jgi:hypothetical protein